MQRDPLKGVGIQCLFGPEGAPIWVTESSAGHLARGIRLYPDVTARNKFKNRLIPYSETLVTKVLKFFVHLEPHSRFKKQLRLL